MTHALAIDTTSDYLSLGVLLAGKPVAHHYAVCGTRIARSILGQIEELLAGAGLTPRDLDVLVVNRGPGSFTGTRIGMSVALTIGRVLAKPVIGVDSLRVLASQVDTQLLDRFHVLLNCSRDEVYHAAYRWQEGRLEATSEIRLTTIALAAEEIGRAPCVVRRFEPAQAAADALFAGLVPAPLRYEQPDALRLLAMGMAQFRAVGETTPETPAPLYLKSEAFRKWVPPTGARP
jgi:tRNA threonylcarbamoyl adenosine modification protein YeaZ